MNKLKLFISFLIFLLPFMVVDFTTPKGFALLVCLICFISNIYIILQCFKCFDCLKCFLFNLRDCSKFFLYKSFWRKGKIWNMGTIWKHYSNWFIYCSVLFSNTGKQVKWSLLSSRIFSHSIALFSRMHMPILQALYFSSIFLPYAHAHKLIKRDLWKI